MQQNSPPYEKLTGDLSGADSRRIDIRHRLVYQVLDEEQMVKVLPMWTHYAYCHHKKNSSFVILITASCNIAFILYYNSALLTV
jgi:hypothetical protein